MRVAVARLRRSTKIAPLIQRAFAYTAQFTATAVRILDAAEGDHARVTAALRPEE
jgi:hypothetical protein